VRVIEKQPEKVEDVKEKRTHFLNSVELKRQVDELQQEVQQLKKSRVKSKSPDIKRRGSNHIIK
jgi:FtsZ-binding cell division protein ZapB